LYFSLGDLTTHITYHNGEILQNRICHSISP
jgi:hypothetical protein